MKGGTCQSVISFYHIHVNMDNSSISSISIDADEAVADV